MDETYACKRQFPLGTQQGGCIKLSTNRCTVKNVVTPWKISEDTYTLEDKPRQGGVPLT